LHDFSFGRSFGEAQGSGFWIATQPKEFEKETGRTFPDTFTVESSKGGHRYFRQNEDSLKRLKMVVKGFYIHG
jgi:hypothetical protein